MVRYSRRDFALGVLFSVLGSASAGCGTILYPERRGQPKGRLDWGVVLLDSLCLLLFFVPGVVAFAVDFSTGAIYLPPEYIEGYSQSTRAPRENWVTIQLPPDELSERRIAAAVSDRVGRRVDLAAPECRREPLRKLEEFGPVRDRLIAELGPIVKQEPGVMRAQSR